MPDHAPDGSIVITPKEFYDGVRADFAKIERRLSEIHADLAPLPQRVEKLEAEVDKIKRQIVFFAGLAAGAGGTVGGLVTKFLG